MISQARGRPLCVVTGARRGIGRAIALAAADAGYDLVLVDRGSAEETEREVRQHGAGCRRQVCDITDSEAIAEFYRGLGADAARLAGLVNNAGDSGERMNLADAPIGMIDRVLATNVRGTILMCQGAVAAMSARGGGAIVNISSQCASFGGNGLTAYAASKAAVNGLTISLARETASAKVRVNAVSPGPVLTDRLKVLTPERLREMEASLPMGRFLTSDEVAAVVVWLLSDAASYVSGAIVPVHGAR